MRVRQLTAPLARALFACALLTLGGCATNPVTQRADFVLMSESQEIELGKETHAQIMRQYRASDDAVLQAVVTRIGRELAAVSHRNHLDYHFYVLDSPQVNAFALPGGYVYITRGIIVYMNSEEELAGVLGHELGHITARHSVRQHAAHSVAGLFGALIEAGGGSQALLDATGWLGGALVSGYGREHELEADRLGAEYLARGGYDPQKMLDVIGILKYQEEFEKQRAREEGREPRVYHGVFATHPDNDKRLREVVAAAERYKIPNAKQLSRERFLRMLEGVTYGDGARDGVARGNKFYHRDLNFTVTLPQQWRIQNQPAQLNAVRADNKAALILQTEAHRGQNSLQHLLRKYPRALEVRRIARGRHAAWVRAETVFGVRTVPVAAVTHGAHTFFITGIADASPLRREVEAAAMSIRKLSADEKTLARARRIKIIRAKPGDTYANFARAAGLGQYGAEKLRLLNGVYPGGEPAPGQLIKVVR